MEAISGKRPRVFDNLTIQAGVLASGITPRYIDDHAAFLHVPPGRLVLKQRTRPSDCTREIFDYDRPKLDSRCGASGNLRFVDINDGIGQPTDTGYDGNCSVPQGAKLRKAAGLEPRRHDQRIDASLNLVSQILVITDRRADLMWVGFAAALYWLSSSSSPLPSIAICMPSLAIVERFARRRSSPFCHDMRLITPSRKRVRYDPKAKSSL